ncbi:Asp-tRNA(Asn)/Glu-tRNA(Gln) amidotransferase subunit GatC [Natronogracilivirga saccharolytica]|uniref:Aspartyl/glutamyl-tRNA(Asn/Gln) amidotransferase subunit C n=1 Tax=Natronogracilivirga saccharolytica TaxID=2812953 RepID=A0A8J7RJD3_9BACT|nr:Asp-tRNA(Asn)/Glu-tRNA(Gln) amidotransferase subunit GatC [Natronogracilivirga saccharolytica]MBP3191253.1 Asp-tRNA(Asn)/Glu-tRNA(Gln) amidotransferase subunit GatC [Natronogracilivirga saccharolytica]
MSVTLEDVTYMANLARLQLTDEEAQGLVKDMNDILEYMELLGQIDSSDVPPLEHVTDVDSGLRPDKALTPLDHEEALKNAPDADADYFRVPRVID